MFFLLYLIFFKNLKRLFSGEIVLILESIDKTVMPESQEHTSAWISKIEKRDWISAILDDFSRSNRKIYKKGNNKQVHRPVSPLPKR